MFHLLIATPETVAYDDKVYSLIIPGTLGYMEILTHHASIITPLQSGKVTLVTKNQEKLVYSISGGIFEFSHNRATLLPDTISMYSSLFCN
ncbi:MAG TPA: F0F1 ATP synthase subunit epsilon [Waddliaceae bacterium]